MFDYCVRAVQYTCLAILTLMDRIIPVQEEQAFSDSPHLIAAYILRTLLFLIFLWMLFIGAVVIGTCVLTLIGWCWIESGDCFRSFGGLMNQMMNRITKQKTRMLSLVILGACTALGYIMTHHPECFHCVEDNFFDGTSETGVCRVACSPIMFWKNDN